jgi:hypothetical protein
MLIIADPLGQQCMLLHSVPWSSNTFRRQVPLTQEKAPLAGSLVAQLDMQSPQWALSFSVFTQVVPHRVGVVAGQPEHCRLLSQIRSLPQVVPAGQSLSAQSVRPSQSSSTPFAQLSAVQATQAPLRQARPVPPLQALPSGRLPQVPSLQVWQSEHPIRSSVQQVEAVMQTEPQRLRPLGQASLQGSASGTH